MTTKCHEKFRYGASLLYCDTSERVSEGVSERVCKQYRRSDNGTDTLCTHCLTAPSLHKLTVKSGATSKTYLPYLTAFAATRNARVALTHSLPHSHTELIESLRVVQCLTITASNCVTVELVDEAAALLQLLAVVKDTPHYTLSFVVQADAFYHRLYYCMSLCKHTSKSPSLVPTIPEPHEYFSEYASDAVQLNSELKHHVNNSFSSDVKAYIPLVFGFLDTVAPPFQHNPLLLLHFSRWRESICLLSRCGMVSTNVTSLVQTLSKVMSSPSHSTDTSTHSTMKKPHDPLLPHYTRIWNDSCRVWSCHLYAYATPSPASLDTLAKYSPLVEIGAGTGYWSSCLRHRHPSIVTHTYDKDPPSASHSSKSNSYHGRAHTWTSVMKGGVEVVQRHEKSTLFLCYPPPDSDMALQALRTYTGKHICHVGEFSGDTGTKSFESLLESTFVCVETVALPNWGDTSYSLTIWKRRSASDTTDNTDVLQHPKRCCVCGMLRPKMFRCRITYGVIFCSDACASSETGKQRHLDELAFKFALLPPATCSTSPIDNNNNDKSETSDSNSAADIQISKSKKKRLRKEKMKAAAVAAAADDRVESDQQVMRGKNVSSEPVLPLNPSYFSTLIIKNVKST